MGNTHLKSIFFSKFIRVLFLILGVFFALLIIVSFTTWPFWGYHWLGTSKSELSSKPSTIIFMGGGGMPSPSNLMRCYYVASAWGSFQESKVLVAIPGDTIDSESTPVKVKNELILRGVQPTAISFENNGTNTRSQALFCSQLLDTTKAILLVTSPEHMRRSVLSFQKVGFVHVNALPAFPNALEADLHFDDNKLGGSNNLLTPDVGNNLSFRYQIWTHLQYEILISREYAALVYYKLRGWI